MKIAIVNRSNYTAIEHYRQVTPHAYLDDNGLASVTMLESKLADLTEYSDEQLKEFDLIQFSRIIGANGNEEKIIERLKGLGLRIIFDIDDYWELPPYHFMYEGYTKYNVPQRTLNCMRLADMATVSTKYLHGKAKEINSNIHVISNSIPSEHVIKRGIKSSRVRFGYAAGVYHLKDAQVLERAISGLYKIGSGVNYDKFQFVLCGFNLNSREYIILERFMTGNYAFSKTERDYSNWLMKGIREGEHIANNQPYKRIWALPVKEYLDCLNNFDVSLAPLYSDFFTKGKSQLKAIEAGMFGKALICSPVEPYSEFEHNKHCLKALTDRDWNLAFKRLIHNKELLKDLQGNLSEYIKENFNFADIQKQRLEIYKTL